MISDRLIAEMTTWRRHLHAHPEFGMEEHATAAFVAETLRGFGVTEITTGVGGTGVVASITRGTSNRAIGLRADMDALRITEATGLPYASQTEGLMHACGHDGHTAMLLGTAKALLENGGFDGTVRLIFQPAEEWGAGMQAMLDDGLLERFPMEEVYGLHNMPGLPVEHFATAPGPLMAAEDLFEIKVMGSGGHSSRPHLSADALLAACEIVSALQTIVSRVIDPAELAVVSVTELTSDGLRNAIASNAVVKGDCRSYSPSVSTRIEAAMDRITAQTAAAHGCTTDLSYTREFVPLINDVEATAHATRVAKTLGPTDPNAAPIGASEDFARILNHIPGNFMFIGNGDSAVLHNASYDFNDAALPHGAGFFTALVQARLPQDGASQR